jgi:S-adenosylmethionine-dependent methyltransferase
MKVDSSRFEAGADKYAAYLATTEGRLRVDLAWDHLRPWLPQTALDCSSEPPRALDLGGGTGAMAVLLAGHGFDVVLMDSSTAMLALAEQAARAVGVSSRISLRRASAAELPNEFPAACFDVIVCHNLLEYVEDPGGILRAMGRALKGNGAVTSILVRNRAGEVLKAGIKSGDLALAEANLTAEWATESLYGENVRLFDASDLRRCLREAALDVMAERGVRVIADYVPASLLQDEKAYARILALEHRLGERPEFAAIARYTQILARPAQV